MGILPMRTVSRSADYPKQERDGECLSFQPMPHRDRHIESPPWPETKCGKVYRAIRWLKGGANLRASREAKRLVTLSLCRCKSCPPDAGVKASPPAQRLVLNGLKRGETAVSGSLTPETRLAGVDG